MSIGLELEVNAAADSRKAGAVLRNGWSPRRNGSPLQSGESAPRRNGLFLRRNKAASPSSDMSARGGGVGTLEAGAPIPCVSSSPVRTALTRNASTAAPLRNDTSQPGNAPGLPVARSIRGRTARPDRSVAASAAALRRSRRCNDRARQLVLFVGRFCETPERRLTQTPYNVANFFTPDTQQQQARSN
jgi:hypothetical protein